MGSPRIIIRRAESGAVEALIEHAERRLTAAERIEAGRISRMFTDQPHARRARRRAGRTVLRMLPGLLTRCEESA